jgi:gliding motility-associated-like protein
MKSVFVLPGPDALLPNAFSPNGDGHNDIFTPIISKQDISGFSMMIFDRWGGKIYETNDIITGWDGTHAGTGRKVQQGVYSYVVFVTMYGIREKYAGSVMVIY